jgi:hypothetical protein
MNDRMKILRIELFRLADNEHKCRSELPPLTCSEGPEEVRRKSATLV